jgi:hypothetical protein
LLKICGYYENEFLRAFEVKMEFLKKYQKQVIGLSGLFGSYEREKIYNEHMRYQNFEDGILDVAPSVGRRVAEGYVQIESKNAVFDEFVGRVGGGMVHDGQSEMVSEAGDLDTTSKHGIFYKIYKNKRDSNNWQSYGLKNFENDES